MIFYFKMVFVGTINTQFKLILKLAAISLTRTIEIKKNLCVNQNVFTYINAFKLLKLNYCEVFVLVIIFVLNFLPLFFSLQNLLHSSRKLSLHVLNFVHSFQVTKLKKNPSGICLELYRTQSTSVFVLGLHSNEISINFN